MPRYALLVNSFEELQVAEKAIQAMLAVGPKPFVPQASVAGDPPALEERIWKALTERPLGPVEHAVVEIMFAHPADTWLPYQDMLKKMEDYGFSNVPGAKGVSDADLKAARALGVLSGRMKEHLLPSDYAGKLKAIEGFASRTKLTPGGISYRLREAGRAALAKLLKS
jgi:hypothetical protein